MHIDKTEAKKYMYTENERDTNSRKSISSQLSVMLVLDAVFHNCVYLVQVVEQVCA